MENMFNTILDKLRDTNDSSYDIISVIREDLAKGNIAKLPEKVVIKQVLNIWNKIISIGHSNIFVKNQAKIREIAEIRSLCTDIYEIFSSSNVVNLFQMISYTCCSMKNAENADGCELYFNKGVEYIKKLNLENAMNIRNIVILYMSKCECLINELKPEESYTKMKVFLENYNIVSTALIKFFYSNAIKLNDLHWSLLAFKQVLNANMSDSRWTYDVMELVIDLSKKNSNFSWIDDVLEIPNIRVELRVFFQFLKSLPEPTKEQQYDIYNLVQKESEIFIKNILLALLYFSSYNGKSLFIVASKRFSSLNDIKTEYSLIKNDIDMCYPCSLRSYKNVYLHSIKLSEKNNYIEAAQWLSCCNNIEDNELKSKFLNFQSICMYNVDEKEHSLSLAKEAVNVCQTNTRAKFTVIRCLCELSKFDEIEEYMSLEADDEFFIGCGTILENYNRHINAVICLSKIKKHTVESFQCLIRSLQLCNDTQLTRNTLEVLKKVDLVKFFEENEVPNNVKNAFIYIILLYMPKDKILLRLVSRIYDDISVVEALSDILFENKEIDELNELCSFNCAQIRISILGNDTERALSLVQNKAEMLDVVRLISLSNADFTTNILDKIYEYNLSIEELKQCIYLLLSKSTSINDSKIRIESTINYINKNNIQDDEIFSIVTSFAWNTGVDIALNGVDEAEWWFATAINTSAKAENSQLTNNLQDMYHKYKEFQQE